MILGNTGITAGYQVLKSLFFSVVEAFAGSAG